MNPIPCKECILYAICKCQAYDYIRYNYQKKLKPNYTLFNLPYNVYVFLLKDKCELIKDWFNEHTIINCNEMYIDDMYIYLDLIREFFCKIQCKG